MITIRTELDHRFNHNFPVVTMLLLLLDHHVHVVFILFGAADQLTETVGFDGVGVGYIFHGTTVDNYLSEHFNLVAAAVTGQPFHSFYPRGGSRVRGLPFR